MPLKQSSDKTKSDAFAGADGSVVYLMLLLTKGSVLPDSACSHLHSVHRFPTPSSKPCQHSNTNRFKGTFIYFTTDTLYVFRKLAVFRTLAVILFLLLLLLLSCHWRALFISAQLSTDAVSALRKVWVLIWLWKRQNVQACTWTWSASAAGKNKRVPSRFKRAWFYLRLRKQPRRL